MNKNIRNAILFISVPLALIIAVMVLVGQVQQNEKPKYYEIVNKIYSGEITNFTLNISSGHLEYYEGDDTSKNNKKTYDVPDVTIFYNDVGEFISEHNKQAIKQGENSSYSVIEYNYEVNKGAWLVNILPTAVLLGALVLFWFMMMKRMGAAGGDKTLGFGKAKFKKTADSTRKTTFADVAGADEEKEELSEIVEFLKNPKRYNDLGARIPKGVLLVGPPGTGKTLLARAVAGEAGVPFFSISGSDFVEMFVGVGASRVRDLFDQAKKNSPAIIFIDEIDAVGRQRGTGLGGGHDEREQTLNQLLVEMDGFGSNEGVIVIAATNRSDILDPALMRPGRFDRQIMVGYPDVKGREEILKVHSRGKPLAPDVDLKVIAKTTAGFTGADLENLLNEAALLTARKGAKAITEEVIEEATIKVVMGVEKKSRVVKESDRKMTSYHEAGHAVVSYFLPNMDEVHQISIIPRGQAGGYTMYRPSDDQDYSSFNELNERICSLLGGRVAEKLTQNDVTTGASNDLKRATEIARKMVMKYGMSDRIGPIVYGSDHDEVFLGRDFSSSPHYSEHTSAQIDEEVKRIVEEASQRCERILTENMGKLHEIAEYLFKNEKMDGAMFKNIMSQPAAGSAQ